MAAASHAAVLVLAGLLAGCLSQGGPFTVSCQPSTHDVLEPVDVLVLGRNRSYEVSVHEHGQTWGKLVIELCEPMPLRVEATVKDDAKQPSRFGFVYFFPEGDFSSALPVESTWGLPAWSSMCQALSPTAVSAPALMQQAAPKERPAGRYVLSAAGDALYASIGISTGTDERPERLNWPLTSHPDLELRQPKAQPVTTADAQMPPRTLRVQWSETIQPLAPSLLHVALWHVRAQGASGGLHWDTARLENADGQTTLLQVTSNHACANGRYGGYGTHVVVQHFDFKTSTISRRYEESSIQSGQGASNVDAALLNIPLDERLASTR